MEGIKTQLGRERNGWVDELPNVLWAHRTSLKTSNRETPYNLMFRSEAVIPVEIGMPTHRTMMIKEGNVNEEEMRLNLDLLTERREAAAIQEARYKMKMEQYYNKRVCPMSFKAAPSRDRQNPLNPGLICMYAVLTKNRWLMGSVWIIGCIVFSRGFFILILLGARSTPVGIWRWLDVGRWVASGGLDPAATYTNMSPLSAVSTKCWCVFLFILSFSFFLLFGYPPFESFAISLEESDDLNIPDAAPVDLVLEAGMTMNALPLGAIRLYAYHFQQGGLQAKPLEALSNEEYASPPLSIGRMDTLRDQTDEHATSPGVILPDVLATFLLLLNGGLRNQAVWTNRALLKLLCQSAQQQANTLLHFEALKEQHADLSYAHKSCKDVKSRYKECRKELAVVQSAYNEKSESDAQQLRVEKECYAVKAGRGEMVRQRIINQYLPTFVRRLHQSAEYKRSLGEVFNLAIGKGFIDGISIGREDADVRAILQDTLNVDHASSDIFMDAYEKLFDQRYPYVDKVARMYLLSPNGLQNIMPDETGPTPGGGPRDTPTASYA
nr:protein NYNRIN-like [Tanacetum cinerariifolium]